jgi:hypothetical protein
MMQLTVNMPTISKKYWHNKEMYFELYFVKYKILEFSSTRTYKPDDLSIISSTRNGFWELDTQVSVESLG